MPEVERPNFQALALGAKGSLHEAAGLEKDQKLDIPTLENLALNHKDEAIRNRAKLVLQVKQWQLARAEEKKDMNNKYLEKIASREDLADYYNNQSGIVLPALATVKTGGGLGTLAGLGHVGYKGYQTYKTGLNEGALVGLANAAKKTLPKAIAVGTALGAAKAAYSYGYKPYKEAKELNDVRGVPEAFVTHVSEGAGELVGGTAGGYAALKAGATADVLKAIQAGKGKLLIKPLAKTLALTSVGGYSGKKLTETYNRKNLERLQDKYYSEDPRK